MPRYKLRTLLIVLAILPPVAGFGYSKWKRYLRTREIIRLQEQDFAEQRKKAAARHAAYLAHIQRIRSAGGFKQAKTNVDAQQNGQ